MNSSYTLLHLSLIPTIGPATVQHLITILGSTEQLDRLYDFSSAQLSARCGITAARAQAIVQGLADKQLLSDEIARIEKHAIAWTSIIASDYPSLLKTIHLPPTVLYWRGVHPATYTKTVAVVGSRDANHYGQSVIISLIPSLVQAGCTIVSGGAVGADSMAHGATLDAHGTTCVVLGSGLLHPYPYHNKNLFATVEQNGGTVLSIFPLDTRPAAHNFPARNRVIAGLSKGCVVIQAAEKSGARITAECALEQGRSVCAVPGAVDDPLSAGCHALIKQGALLVTSAEDILQELQYQESQTEKPNIQKVQAPQEDIMAAQIMSSSTSPVQQVLFLCARPVSIDTLLSSTELPLAELNELLFELQIAGKITQSFTGLWCKR